ncbi:MAG: DNA primase [Muribaculaceae bacterium]|nr:DNA primase [Muribaculaceae bacterium]
MPLIDKETIQRITDAADIVEVVGDYVHLVRRGANYMGLCPFHNERTPSFSVNKRKNFCYCFSCKQGGSPVNFIMKKEGLSYHEALLHLARKYGIEVKQRELTDEERKQQSEREAMFVANEWAMLRMKENLFSTEEGKNIGLSYFFGQRGITQEACDAFRLGYAIDNGNSLTNEAKKAGLDLNVLKKVGLLGESHEGRIYDKYRGRVIFPILNTAGKVIGFGGRTLKNDKAKYINSPESEIYKKSNELYGIFQARNSIGREDKCYLVEGYFDVIGMWQSGMKNVVASSGTALTDGQIALIHRFTENITLIYDGDRAGIKAALRGVDMLLHHKMKVKVLLLPDGDDPDSFARKHTPEEFREFVAQNETDVITFKARVLVNDIKGDPQGRIYAIQDMVTTLAHIADPISRDVYIQECSSLMQVPEETILKSVVKKRAELVENWKKERWNKNEISEKRTPEYAPKITPSPTVTSGNDNPDDAFFAGMLPTTQNISINENRSDRGNKLISKRSPLFPLEKRIMEFVVKYGFLPFCCMEEDDDKSTDETKDVCSFSETSKRKIWWNIAEFISAELNDDNISFSEPIFTSILQILLDMKSSFTEARKRKETELKINSDNLRKNGYDRIAAMNLSVSEIQREERKLEDDIAEIERNELADFDKHFPARALSNHEDDQIREMATELAIERHQLSNIYYRDNNVVETEEDKLNVLVPRAVDELKSEILRLQVQDLFIKMSEADDPAVEISIQKQINDKIHLRAILAKNLGERIISPLDCQRK